MEVIHLLHVVIVVVVVVVVVVVFFLFFLQVVTWDITARDLSVWDVSIHDWRVESGSFGAKVGKSSRDEQSLTGKFVV